MPATVPGGGGSRTKRRRGPTREQLARAMAKQIASSHAATPKLAAQQRTRQARAQQRQIAFSHRAVPRIAAQQRAEADLTRAIRRAGMGGARDLLAEAARPLLMAERRARRRGGWGPSAEYVQAHPDLYNTRYRTYRLSDVTQTKERGHPGNVYLPKDRPITALQAAQFQMPFRAADARSAYTDLVRAIGLRPAEQIEAMRKVRRMAPATKVLEQLQRGAYASGGVIHGLKEGDVVKALEGAYKGGITMQEKYTPGEEIIGKGGGALGSLGRFVLDVGLDPTTWVTLGGASIAGKTAAKAAIRAEVKAARVAYKSALAEGVSRGTARKLAKDAGRRQGQRAFDAQMAAAEERGLSTARGLQLRVAGGRTARKLATRLAPKGTRRVNTRVVDRKRVERAAAAPLTRPTAAFGTARRAGTQALFETKPGQLLARKMGVTEPGLVSRTARRIGSELHGRVRDPDIRAEDWEDLTAIVREARSAEEHGVRMSIARANLGRKLSRDEDDAVIDAIERDRLRDLSPDLRKVAKFYRDDLRYRYRRESRAGTQAAHVERPSATEVRARTGAERAERGRKEFAGHWAEEKETIGRAETRLQEIKREQEKLRHKAASESARSESAWFSPRPSAKTPTHGRGFIDPEGKLHTWKESEGTHAEVARARGFNPNEVASFMIRPNGEISVHTGGRGMADPEIIARAVSQDERLKVPSELDPGSRPLTVDPRTGEARSLASINDELARIADEPGPRAAAQRRVLVRERQAALTAEAERIQGKVLPRAHARAGRARKQLKQRQKRLRRNLAWQQEAAAKRKAKAAYFPRIPQEHVRGTQTVWQRLAAPLKPKREAVSSSQPRPLPSKGRVYKGTREQMREGTPAEQAAVARQEPRSGASVAYRGISGARGERKGIVNRQVAERFGEPSRDYVKRMRDEHGKDWEFNTQALEDLRAQGKSVYRVERGDLVQLGKEGDDIQAAVDEIRTGLKTADERAARARQVQAMRDEGFTNKQIREALGGEAETGRYVVLDDALVAHAQKGQRAFDTDSSTQLWDLANRGFKTLALATPQYLARNFAGDMFNAWTEENALRLMRNSGRSQKVLHQLGRYERGIALGAQKGRISRRTGEQKLDAVGRLQAAGKKFAGLLPSNKRMIQLTPEQARELSGPSSQRLYNLLKRSNPDLSKQQIRDEIERNLSSGKIPAIHVAMLAEQMGVIRNGRFLELMQEGRSEFGKGKGRTGTSAWQSAVKRVEDSTRLATFLGGLGRGMSPREAANRATRLHFDYGALTQRERDVFRRLMPFYTFPSRNIPLQARQVITRPGKYATLEKARQTAAEMAGLDDEGKWQKNLSEFEARQLPFPVRWGTDKDGKPQIVTLSMGSPFTDLNDLTSFAEGFTGGNKGRDILNLGTIPLKRGQEMLGPWKLWPELYNNKSLFFREDIAKKGARLTQAPKWAVLLGQIPGGPGDAFREITGMDRFKGKGPWMWDKRAEYAVRGSLPGITGAVSELGGAVTGLGAEKNWRGRTPKQKALNFFTGIRATTVDQPAAREQGDYARAAQLDTLMENYRQLAKGAGITDPKLWKTKKYQRWLDERNAIRRRQEGETEEAAVPPTGAAARRAQEFSASRGRTDTSAASRRRAERYAATRGQ